VLCRQPHPHRRPLAAAISPAGATVIDGAARPDAGHVRAHTTSRGTTPPRCAGIQTMPLEEHVLWARRSAKRYLEAG
jgi:hypothetical protein